MDVILIAHIFGGSLAIAAGFVAMTAPKGARWHRRSGMVFFYAMLLMATLAVLMAGVRGVAPAGNIAAGLLTIYLVVTGVQAVRPPGPPRIKRHLVRMCLALFIASGSFFLGQQDEFPRELRGQPIFTLLAVAPLITLLFWLWRLRRKGAPRLIRTDQPQSALSARPAGSGT
ncbi:MAG TPA: hypothetical protein VFS91_07810 [Nitrobacter sp.]|nr:hypothetical protein [Nitrobacter sp.]